MAEPSEIHTRPALVEMLSAGVTPPGRVYMAVNDRLYIRSRNSLASVTLTIAGRILTAGGEIVPFNHEHTPATDRTASIESFQLAEGFLLSAVVFPSAGAPIRGQTFVELGFLRGLNVAGAVVDVLARDYVSEDEPLAFPGSHVRSSLEGPGAIRSITGTDQAAGAEVQETVPDDARWRFISLDVTFVTSATAATRNVNFTFDDGTTIFYRTLARSNQTASNTHIYIAAATAAWDTQVFSRHLLPVPENFMLLAGYRINTDVQSGQAGDDFGAPQLLVEEWLED